MGAEIFLHSAWDAYCKRLPLRKERGWVDPMAKADPMHLGRDVWHLGSVVDSIADAEERLVGNGYFRCGDDLMSAMGLSWSNTVAPLLDEQEFLSPYGIRALSQIHQEQPYTFQINGDSFGVGYEPAESATGETGSRSAT